MTGANRKDRASIIPTKHAAWRMMICYCRRLIAILSAALLFFLPYGKAEVVLTVDEWIDYWNDSDATDSLDMTVEKFSDSELFRLFGEPDEIVSRIKQQDNRFEIADGIILRFTATVYTDYCIGIGLVFESAHESANLLPH